jgi:hypothetical protein
MYVSRNTEARSLIIFAIEKQQILLIRLFVNACACMLSCGYPGACACACLYVHVALLIQHATHMRHIETSFVVPRFTPKFSTVPHKRCDFREKKPLNIKYVF